MKFRIKVKVICAKNTNELEKNLEEFVNHLGQSRIEHLFITDGPNGLLATVIYVD